MLQSVHVRGKLGVAGVAGFVELFAERQHGVLALVFGLRLALLGQVEKLSRDAIPVSSRFACIGRLKQQVAADDEGGGAVLNVQGYTHGGARVLDGPRAGTVLARSLGVSQTLPAFRPDDKQSIDRFSGSIYGAATLHIAPNWLLDLAGRLETYADFGGAQTGRVSTRYDFNPAFAIRATVANGFHAPALAAQAYKNTGNANTSTNHVLQVASP